MDQIKYEKLRIKEAKELKRREKQSKFKEK